MEIVLNPFIGTIFNLFLISALVITMYTLNFYYLVLLSSRRIANMDVVAFKADSVTIHLPTRFRNHGFGIKCIKYGHKVRVCSAHGIF